ncbi:MAG: prevent-host-death protein [Puniceicoccales bacterium]
MTETISATKASRHLGELLARIKYKGDRFILTKNDLAIAELHAAPGVKRGTLGEIRDALAHLPSDNTFAEDLETVNRADQPPVNPWQ